jgi:hypothetical protein
MKLKFEIQISGVASISDQFEAKNLNSKLETLPSPARRGSAQAG